MGMMDTFIAELLIRHGREGFISSALDVRPSFWLLASDQGLIQTGYSATRSAQTYCITDKGLEFINETSERGNT